jgi:hypothetical protein
MFLELDVLMHHESTAAVRQTGQVGFECSSVSLTTSSGLKFLAKESVKHSCFISTLQLTVWEG